MTHLNHFKMMFGIAGLVLALIGAAMMLAAHITENTELDHDRLVIEIQSDAIDSCRQNIDSLRRTIEALKAPDDKKSG
jgi:hypothetical protein